MSFNKSDDQIPWDILRLPAAPSNSPPEEQELLDFVQQHFLSGPVTDEINEWCCLNANKIDLTTDEHCLSYTTLHRAFLSEIIEPHLEVAVSAFGTTHDEFVVVAARSEAKSDDVLLKVLRETISYEQFSRLMRRAAHAAQAKSK